MSQKVVVGGVEYVRLGMDRARRVKEVLDDMADRDPSDDDETPYMYRRLTSGKYGYFDERGYLMYVRVKGPSGMIITPDSD